MSALIPEPPENLRPLITFLELEGHSLRYFKKASPPPKHYQHSEAHVFFLQLKGVIRITLEVTFPQGKITRTDNKYHKPPISINSPEQAVRYIEEFIYPLMEKLINMLYP